MPSKRRRTRLETGKDSLRVCSREKCRREFVLTAEQDKHVQSGLCPTCKEWAAAKRGDLLDPVIYAECQRVLQEEKALVPVGGNIRATKARLQAYTRERLAAMKPPRANPEITEALLGGPSPGGRSGKVGGPNGRE